MSLGKELWKSFERLRIREYLVEDDAGCPDVRRLTVRLLVKLLGRHVPWCADEIRMVLEGVQVASEPEVAQTGHLLDTVFVLNQGDEDVARFDVPVEVLPRVDLR